MYRYVLSDSSLRTREMDIESNMEHSAQQQQQQRTWDWALRQSTGLGEVRLVSAYARDETSKAELGTMTAYMARSGCSRIRSRHSTWSMFRVRSCKIQSDQLCLSSSLFFVFNPCFVLCSAVIGHTTIDLNILPETQPASEVQYGPV